jgi:hypothetical protein
MKKCTSLFVILFVALLLIQKSYSQNNTTVRGVKLSYDSKKRVMTLTTSHKIMYTNDYDSDVCIEINKGYSLKMVMNGITYSMTEPYFKHIGHTREMGWAFSTTQPRGLKTIKENYIYQFSDVQPGEEYVMTVSTICDDKYVTNEEKGSIVIE